MSIVQLNATKTTSNGWDVTKFEDGRMIATLVKNYGTLTCSGSWYGWWYCGFGTDQALPDGFTTVPIIYGTYIGGNGLFEIRAANVTKTKVGFFYLIEARQNASFSDDVHLLA